MADTLTALLAERVRETPDAVFVRTREGELTYAEAEARAGHLAGGLRARGVARGTPVALLMRNGLRQVECWLGLARLGAVHVPLNTALVGDRLAHALDVARPELLVADPDLRPAADAVLGGAQAPPVLVAADTVAAAATPAPIAEVDELAVATLLFTSGTTGASKACALSHRYLARQGQIHARQLRLHAGDVLYCPFPLFHVDAATLTVGAALACGATAALGRRFSVSGFWDEIRAFDATVFNFMGATLSMLWERPPSERDRDHRVRLAWGVPMPEWKAGFEARFGFPLYELYGLTDGGMPVYQPLDEPYRPGRTGRVVDEFEVRLDAGTREILIRGREPGLTMLGYHGMPEATAAALRDGWLHTGDLGSLDADGWLAFEGRLGDSIRRRGENISAQEVEALAELHPDVLEAAAFGVPSELTEEDVMLCAVVRDGSGLDAARVHAHLRAMAPRFMVPRYVELVDALPRTPTQKLEKAGLRAAATGPRTWDAERER